MAQNAAQGPTELATDTPAAPATQTTPETSTADRTGKIIAPCGFCGKVFVTLYNRKRHLKNVHGGKSEPVPAASVPGKTLFREDIPVGAVIELDGSVTLDGKLVTAPNTKQVSTKNDDKSSGSKGSGDEADESGRGAIRIEYVPAGATIESDGTITLGGKPVEFGANGKPVGGQPEDKKPDSFEETWKVDVFECSRLVDVAEEKVENAAEQVVNAKAKLKAAESDFAAAVRELRNTIKGRGQAKLPFGKPGVTATEHGPDEPTDAEPRMIRLLSKDCDEWRLTALTSLPESDLSGHVIQPLIDADLLTIGALASYCESNTLCDIKGVGEAKAKRIEDALEKYWQSVQTTAGEPVSTDACEGEV